MQDNIKSLQKKMLSMGLTHPSLQSLWECSQEVNYKKGKLLVKTGKIEQYLYFILKGVARIFIKSGDKEITFCFCTETDVLFSYNSFFNQVAGYETVELLENTSLLKIHYKAIKELCKNDIATANFFNKLIGTELVKTEARLISSQSKSASERYEELVKNSPLLIQRVQLGYIASYLGISQVTLSRIRKKPF